ncbi:MAG: hypothetical protein QE271_06275 [Bacteriovoracaceae bacterium]|nr:hypothetical protein [Bacteriovoracaceae bacterium]
MKRKNEFELKLTLFFFLFSIPQLGLCFKGRDGNGGNQVAMRFTEIATESLKYLEKNTELYPNINLKSLNSSIETTKIYSVTYKLCSKDDDRSCPDESGFVAKNYPDKGEILINENLWQSLVLEEKIKIVLHEYFGIMGIELSNYVFSSTMKIALEFQETNQYACQLALFQKNLPQKFASKNFELLGNATLVINSTGAEGKMLSSPLLFQPNIEQKGRKSKKKDTDLDVVFRLVVGKNYLRGNVELAKVNRKTKHFIDVTETTSVIFENTTFFEGEPIGIKNFESKDYKLQVACSHI